MSKARICLVSPGHIASNPRLVKEADALHAAGFRVRVVAGDYMAAVRPLDESILANAPWQCVRVGLGSPLSRTAGAMLQRGAQLAVTRLGHLPVAIRAHSRVSYRLAAAALAEPAEMYLAHNLAALPAAARAARRCGAKLGFDAEDYHLGELEETQASAAAELTARALIEQTLLPQCRHLTAASPKIAEAYAARYGVTMTPILNVFPRADAPLTPQRAEGDRAGGEPSLYWFSQTIGPGRGLESVVKALGQMQVRARLHLRGLISADYRAELQRLAAAAGVADRLHLLAPALPSEMARLAASHDVGLALELNEPLNRSICLTNKAFIYLLAGIPMLLSDTPAQRQLAGDLGHIAPVVKLDETQAIARTLDQLLSAPTKLQAARHTAWRLGQERYNWDVEQHKFLRSVAEALA